jgi:phosphoribosylformylglycinamidine (FGAM) synthase-like amidotransferase family enzyme
MKRRLTLRISTPGSRVRAHAARGGLVLGICNGFQILCESGLLPGVLMRNALDPRQGLGIGVVVALAVGDADVDDLPLTIGAGALTEDANRNGSINSIAGIYSATRTVLGLMPHPENFVEDLVDPPAFVSYGFRWIASRYGNRLRSSAAQASIRFLTTPRPAPCSG